MDKRVLSPISALSRILFGLSILTLLMLPTTNNVIAAGTLFVNPVPTGSGDCSSWTNACTLQTALTLAATGDEIWVAEGVYYPGTNREDSFFMKTGVAVYGGFAGGETALEERDWFTNPTVLSGDIDLNDTNKDANGIVTNISGIVGDNAYHVLVGSGVDATAVFDGFIINAGKANGSTLYHNQGGGVYLTLGNPTLNNLVISANTASNAGGGLYNDRSNASLSNLAVRGNNVTEYTHPGGGMFNHIGSPILSNVLFSGNYAYDSGGFFTDGGTPSLINVTFGGNRSDRYGALHVGGGTPIVTNAIFWGNSGSISGSGATVTYSIVQGGYTGTGNLDVDPLFMEVRPWGEAPTTAGDYHLRYGSVATDIGFNDPVITDLDLDGNPRIADGDGDGTPQVDLGAYEQLPGNCGPDGMLFVNHSATGANTGLSWTDAFTDLQSALATARNCEVWVAQGVYYPTTTTDRTQAFLLRSGVQVYGGFAGTETLLSERDWFANPTVLSGDIDGNDTNKDVNGIVTNVSGIVGDNAYHVLVGSGVDSTAVFDGFIINAGQANGTTLYHNQGGGVYLTLGNPTLNNLVITANTASNAGGGIYNDRSNASLSNLAVRGNNVTEYTHPGGGMFNHIGSPILSNVLFSGNYAYDSGGFFTDGGTPSLINVTFSGNRSDRYGSLHVGGGTATLTNAIFWGNYASISGTATVTNSIVQGGHPGEGNIDVDPLFVEVRPWGEAPTTAGDYHLRYGSVATDIGLNTPVVTDLDLDRNPRIADGDGDGTPQVDLGAYEQIPGDCTEAGMLFVNQAATGANTGLSWTDAFTDLQSALATARNCQVWVAQGVYYPTSTTDRTQAFLLRSGVAVYGGFDGTETLLEERDWFANPTILSGDIDGNDTNIDGNFLAETPSDIQGNNAYHVLFGSGADETAVFDGFIINAGKADGTTLYHNQGAGVYLTLGNPTLNNLVISANTASGAGGGIYNDRSNASLSNLAVRGNTVSEYVHPGGGMFNHIGSPTLSNVLFSGNYAYDSGGLFTDDGNPSLINVTFGGNRSDRYGSLHVGGGTATLTNAIFWGNYASISGTATVTNSIVQGGHPGEGNLNVDPLFVEVRSYGEAPTTAGDYRLQHTSPAIEVGNNTPVTALTDLDGNSRLVDGDGDGLAVVDIGAYEWQGYTLTVNIAGEGTVSQDPERSRFGYLEQVSLNATADTGWYFAGWSGDVESTDNPLIVTMDSHTSITANFIQIEYTLTITPDGSGTVSVDPPQATYHYNDVVTLTPLPDPGWSFDSWDGDASGADNPLSVTILGDTNITATFTQDEYLLTITPDGSGTVSVDPPQATYHYNDVVTLTPVPDPGWSFDSWGGDASGTDNPLSYTILGDTNITATFTQDEYLLTVTLIGSGTVSIDPEQATYHYGDEVTLLATPKLSWAFYGWDGDATGTDNPLTISIVGHATITATFITYGTYLPLIIK